VAECVQAGVNLINLSLALVESSAASERAVKEALDWAAKRGVLIVAAAGNDGVVGGSAITRHPGVLPVAACDQRGGPLNQSNVGHAIGRRGLMAPGQGFPIPDVDGEGTLFGGTSAATAFVTGAVALLQSVFPRLSLAVIRQAITGATTRRRTTVVPPVLDAWAAYESLTRIS
jgi:subtilisin family serine protease